MLDLKIFLHILLLLFCSQSFSQNVILSGLVVDEDNDGIKDVSIRIEGKQGIAAYTNEKGYFEIEVAPNQEYVLSILFSGKEPLLESVNIGPEDKFIGKFKLEQNQFGPVQVTYIRPGEFVDRFPPVDLNRLPSPSGNFEDLIKIAGLGVASNNELTSNYNVRGGNYDENLIYVNGIQIYRPFLVRSGQQEGLSFINSAFVENISFSVGGFDAT